MSCGFSNTSGSVLAVNRVGMTRSPCLTSCSPIRTSSVAIREKPAVAVTGTTRSNSSTARGTRVGSATSSSQRSRLLSSV